MAKNYLLIIDSNGLDTFMEANERAQTFLAMRMRLNSHRRPKGYQVNLDDAQVATLKSYTPEVAAKALLRWHEESTPNIEILDI